MNNFDNITTEIIAIPPPITADIKLLNVNKQILETMWPNKLDGRTIKQYLKVFKTKLIFKLGIHFLIFLKQFNFLTYKLI